MKTIPLTRGLVTMVDDADFEKWSGFSMYAAKRGTRTYAHVYIPGVRKQVFLHRLLLNLTDPKIQVDHVNGDGLNNTRANIRACSAMENKRGHQLKKIGASSRFRGVCWDRQMKKWRTYIQVDRVLKFIGLFDREEDAAHAYDAAAHKFFGAFASPNFPPAVADRESQTETQ